MSCPRGLKQQAYEGFILCCLWYVFTRRPFETELGTMKSDLTGKFLGCMLGSALGDAIGELAFGLPDRAKLMAEVDRISTLTYTDDTAMAIGIAESLAQHGSLDQQRLGRQFHDNYRREPWRGYAAGPPSLFALVERNGVPYAEVARQLFGGEGSMGNGASMRIGPIGLYFHARPDLDDVARASAAVTHVHPVGLDGAAVQAKSVAQAVALDRSEPIVVETFCRKLFDIACTEQIRERIKLVQDLLEKRVPPRRAIAEIGFGVAVHESMPFALYAFLANPKSFEECLLCAVLNGGDADTLGAMACAISGACLGIESIPAPWANKLENRNYLESLARTLAKRCELDDPE